MGKIINKMFDFLEKNNQSIFFIPKFIFIAIPFFIFVYIFLILANITQNIIFFTKCVLLIAKNSYFFKK